MISVSLILYYFLSSGSANPPTFDITFRDPIATFYAKIRARNSNKSVDSKNDVHKKNRLSMIDDSFLVGLQIALEVIGNNAVYH